MKKLFFMLSFFFLFVSQSWASTDTHYVTQNGTGDGSTYANAMSLSDFNSSINWDTDVDDDNKIGPGDTVYICDTITSIVRIKGNGASGNPITIRGDYAAHNAVFNITSSPWYCIYVNNNDYITITDITIELPDISAEADNTYAYGICVKNGSKAFIVKDSTITYSGANNTAQYWKCVIIFGPSNAEVTNNTISGGTQGVSCYNGGIVTISGNTISGQVDGFIGSGDCIQLSGTVTTQVYDYDGSVVSQNDLSGWGDDAIDLFRGKNVIIEYNYVHDATYADNYAINGIKLGGNTTPGTTGNIARYNYIKTVRGTHVNASNYGITTNGADSSTAYGNIIVDCAVGIILSRWGEVMTVYNNTIVKCERAIQVAGSSMTLKAKNNILDGSVHDLSTGGTVTGQYNIFVNDASPHIWGKPPGSYSDGTGDQYQAGASTIFRDYAQNDFGLRSDAPAVDAGIQLATDYQYALSSTSSWPDSVAILDQNHYGGVWEIGCYVYDPDIGQSLSPPKSLRTR